MVWLLLGLLVAALMGLGALTSFLNKAGAVANKAVAEGRPGQGRAVAIGALMFVAVVFGGMFYFVS